MKRLALIAAMALVASPALAIDWCTANMPPDGYRGEPPMEYTVSAWPHDLLESMCSNGGMAWRPEGRLGGCAIRDDGTGLGLIYVWSGLSPEHEECVIVHEKAHLNGWKHPRETPFGPRFRRTRPAG